MHRGVRKSLTAVVAAACLSPMLSCSTPGVISSATGTTTFRLVPSTTSRFATATLLVTAVKVRPVSPAAQSSLGDQVFALFTGSGVADLNNTAPQPVYSSTLGAGTYEVTELSLGSVVLAGRLQPESPPDPCLDWVDDTPDDEKHQQVAATVILAPPSPAVTFTVTGAGSTVIDLRIDTEALVNRFLGSFTCTIVVPVPPPDPPPPPFGALSNFDPAAYSQDLYGPCSASAGGPTIQLCPPQ